MLQSDLNIAKKANKYFKVATPTITNIGTDESVFTLNTTKQT